MSGTSSATLRLLTQFSVCCIDQSNPPVISVIGLVLVVFLMLWVLGKASAEYLRVVVFLTSFSGFLTLVLVGWIRSAGGIDASGHPVGRLGDLAMSIFGIVVDTDGDAKILLAFGALALVPQFISYIVLAVYGLSARIVLTGTVVTWYMWLVAKSQLTLSGMLFALACYGRLSGWHNWLGASTGHKAIAALWYLLFSFQGLIALLDSKSLFRGKSLLRFSILRTFHTWATRNVKATEPITPPGAGSFSLLGPTVRTPLGDIHMPEVQWNNWRLPPLDDGEQK